MDFKKPIFSIFALALALNLFGQTEALPKYFFSSNISYSSGYNDVSSSFEIQKRIGNRVSIEIAPEIYLTSIQRFRAFEITNIRGQPSGIKVSGFYLSGENPWIFAMGAGFRYGRLNFNNGANPIRLQQVSVSLIQEIRNIWPSGFLMEARVEAGPNFKRTIGGYWFGGILCAGGIGLGYCF